MKDRYMLVVAPAFDPDGRAVPVPESPWQTVLDTVPHLFGLIDIHHFIRVQVVPAYVVECPDGSRGFGAFTAYGRAVESWPPDSWLDIYVAAERLTSDESYREWLHRVQETLVHELVHYEQWRDGIECHHRGMAGRVAKILRLARNTGAP